MPEQSETVAGVLREASKLARSHASLPPRLGRALSAWLDITADSANMWLPGGGPIGITTLDHCTRSHDGGFCDCGWNKALAVARQVLALKEATHA